MSEESKNEASKAPREGFLAGFVNKFRTSRVFATVTVIVAVIVVAGIGFYAWHNTPGFCGTMCHQSMGYYSESYAKDAKTLAYQHGKISGNAKDTLKTGIADKSNACLDCHPARIGEQIAELGMTIDGNYTVTTEGRVVIENGHYQATKEFCLQCHDYEKVIESTANYNGGSHDSASGIFNPHASHQGDLECGSCHNVHGTSVMYCTSCHEAEVPEGWQSVAQSNA